MYGVLPGAPVNKSDDNTKALEKYFKGKGWEYDWDFKARTGEYWYDIMLGGKILMQIEVNCPVKQVEEDIHKNVKGYDGTLESIEKYLNGQNLYIKKD